MRRKDSTERRQTVCFTAVDPTNDSQRDEPHDVKEPREVPCRMKWNVHQNAVCWINLQSAQDRGLAFWQTHSNASILDNSVPADCLQKVVRTKNEEILTEKIRLSPRLPRKFVLKSASQAQNEKVVHLKTGEILDQRREGQCTSFTCALVSSVTVLALHSRTLSQGP